MLNETFVNALVNFIRKGVINPKTKNPFKVADILDEDYRVEVQNRLNQES